DVTNLFLGAGLPVARILATELDQGIVVHEDFGDEILRDALADPERGPELIQSAIGLIARIQAATPLAFEIGSIASKLKFDEEKLFWELDFFMKHYFESLQNQKLSADLEKDVRLEFMELSRAIESLASVLTHRDFHAANLMIKEGELKIIDHQDARIGPATYDLVSLLLDRITSSPDKSQIEKGKQCLQRARLDLELPRIENLDHEFELVAIQRCLKAIGTFSNQTANLGKDGYLQFIAPMFGVVAAACLSLGAFENIRSMVENEL
ncbi:MAG: phosphotransferase, partial [Acidobacteriota bacterium]|nr:phosphotransferase [Acidobacteriota bacterium]